MEHPLERARALREELAHHEHRYHVLESPTISARRFRAMLGELATLERDPDVGVSRDSATLRTPAAARAAFGRAAHLHRWRDPREIRSPAELRSYHGELATRDPRGVVCVGSGWITGAEVALTYVDGCLAQALLRGDGVEGDDVTANVRTIGGVPLKLRPPGSVTDTQVSKLMRRAVGPTTTSPVPPFPNQMVVQGVISMRLTHLLALDRQRLDAGESPYVNAEAAILASVRALDPRVTASRKLTFMARTTGEVPVGVETHWQLLGSLKSWGFSVTPLTWRCEGLDEMLDFVSALQTEKPKFDFPLDGGLLTSNRLGDPSSATTVRLTFVTIATKAKVKSVYRAVGRTGAVLPVALLGPVEDKGGTIPDGAPIPAATGTEMLGVQAGLQVRVVSGAAAPLLEIDDPAAAPPPEPLGVCPTCRTALRQPADAPFGYCDNRACRGRARSKLLHLTGARGLGLRSLSARVVETLLPNGGVGLQQLLALTEAEVERSAEGLGAKFAAELVEAKRMPLWRLLYLSSIDHMSERAARAIAAHLVDVEGLRNWARGQRGPIPHATPESVDGLSRWLAEDGPAVIENLQALGVVFIGDTECFSAPFLGRRVALAGRFERFGIDRAIDELERRGGAIDNRVSRLTDLVVTGQDAGEALAIADRYGLPVVDEVAFATVLQRT